ncbi:SpoIID/LytB domain-containing protein [Patescibacteria group bacterium]
MFYKPKNRPMTGAVWAISAYKQEEEKRHFKGTLLGIVVSFFILVSLAFLLNLAENYWYLNNSSPFKNTEAGTGGAISESKRQNDGQLGFFHKILGIKEVHAAERSDYKAFLLLRSAQKLELAPNEEVIYRVGFKNVGNTEWYNNDRNFVSIYTYSPKYRRSSLQGSGWYRYNQPAKLRESKVNIGGLGFLEFKIKAPSQEGEYTETYHLAAEDKAWIEGGEFSIPIVVNSNKSVNVKIIAPVQNNSPPAPSATLIPAAPTVVAPNPNYSASLLLASHKKIDAKAGEVVALRYGFKNTGTMSWNMQGLVASQETLLSNGRSIFYTPLWTSGHQPIAVSHTVKPGQLDFIDFKLRVPDKAGTYTAKFKLVANYDKEVSGGYIEIPVYVTDESAGADQSGKVVNVLNMQEPDLEIGLYYLTNSTEAVELTADKPYILYDKDKKILASLSAYESTRITYNFSTKIFTIRNARFNMQVAGELDFKGINNDTIFTILSMSRQTSNGWNDNKYRDEIILRQAQNTGRLWVINKLPMEHYLWGMAETSNISPLDYIKSIIVASRTYALYHYSNPYKYSGYFTMRATTADQLYRGYNSEARRSRVKQAVNETKGEVVTYAGDIVITPYFGHSDGRTRSWSEVWGGSDKPWLKPVSVPSDVGSEMFGHGVGMSALGAYHNANTDGWNYVKILKHYYTGVEISKVY